jgi:hypothetical protein
VNPSGKLSKLQKFILSEALEGYYHHEEMARKPEAVTRRLSLPKDPAELEQVYNPRTGTLYLHLDLDSLVTPGAGHTSTPNGFSSPTLVFPPKTHPRKSSIAAGKRNLTMPPPPVFIGPSGAWSHGDSSDAYPGPEVPSSSRRKGSRSLEGLAAKEQSHTIRKVISHCE